MKDETKKIAVWPIVLMVLLLALVVLPFFVGFKDGEYTFCHYEGNQAISAASVSLYGCFAYHPLSASLFYIGLAIEMLTGAFGLVGAFVYALREKKCFGTIMVLGFAVGAILLLLGSTTLALQVEKVSADYFVAVEREVEPISGFLRANVIFYIEMITPSLVAIWMLWVTLASKKQDALLRASSRQGEDDAK